MLNHNTIDIFGIWSKMTSNVNMGPCPYFGLKWGSKWVKRAQIPINPSVNVILRVNVT